MDADPPPNAHEPNAHEPLPADFGLRVALLGAATLMLVGCVVALASMVFAPKASSQPDPTPVHRTATTGASPNATPLVTLTSGDAQPTQPTTAPTATQPESGGPKPTHTPTPTPTATPTPTLTPTPTATPTPTPTPTLTPTPNPGGG